MVVSDMGMSKRDRPGTYYFSSHHGHREHPEWWIRIMGLHARRGPGSDPAPGPGWQLTCFHDPVRLELDGRILAVPDQSLLVLRPQRAVRVLATDRAQGFLHSWLRVSGRRADEVLRAWPHEGRALRFGDQAVWDRCWLALYRELVAHRVQSPRILALLLELLLAEVERAAAEPERGVIPPALMAAHRFISDHPEQRLSIARVAAVAGCSRRHLARGFRAAFGASPRAIHQRVRFAHAEDLLRDPSRSLAEVAGRTGYADAFAFSKAFKRHHGVSPQRWRVEQGVGPGG